MSSAEKIKKLFAKFKITVSSKVDDRIIRDTLTAFDESKDKKSFPAGPDRWRIIMNSRISKIAFAALIIVTIFIGINYFSGSIGGASVAFGEVLWRIHNTSYSFDMTTFVDGKAEGTNRGMMLQPGILRFDAPEVMGGLTSIANFNTGDCLLLFHGQKTAVNMDKIPGVKNIPDDAGPFSMLLGPVENLWNLQDGTEKSLGEKEMDSQVAVGFEVRQKDEDLINDIVVWASKETGNPIQVEITTYNPENLSESVTMVMSDFNLDVGFDEELFSLEPPEDYTFAHQKTLVETTRSIESTPEAEKLLQSLEFWGSGEQEKSVETMLSVDWTQPFDFSDEIYFFSMTEKGYIQLKLKDQQKVMRAILDMSKRIGSVCRKMWEMAKTARSKQEYERAEEYLKATLSFGRLINRDSEITYSPQMIGHSLIKKSLTEMQQLYTESGEREKLQRVQENSKKIEAEIKNLKEQIKK